MSDRNRIETVELLLVEDNPGDVRLTREAWKEARIPNRLHVVGDGLEALSFLRREGRHADAVRPHLILLDLNLPKKDGRAVLAEIKKDPDLKHIPVVILTTSKAEQDVIQSYGLHANGYVSKPLDMDHFIQVVRSIEEFWLATATLPPRGTLP